MIYFDLHIMHLRDFFASPLLHVPDSHYQLSTFKVACIRVLCMKRNNIPRRMKAGNQPTRLVFDFSLADPEPKGACPSLCQFAPPPARSPVETASAS